MKADDGTYHPSMSVVGRPTASQPLRTSTPDELPSVPAIDVHTHLFPERLQRAIRGALRAEYGWECPTDPEPTVFAEIAHAHLTQRFVLLPYAHKPGMADALNAWIAETASRLEGAIPFACVHPEDDIRVTLEDAYARGAQGVKMHHQVQQVAPDDPRLEPLYVWLQERDLPLLAHAGRGPTDNGLVGPERVRVVLERHPDLRLCVPHLGMPDAEAFLALASDHPNLRLDVSGIGDQIPERRLLEPVIGQILYGTDAPNVPWGYGVTARAIRALGLSLEHERLVFRDNAQAWLAA